MEIKDKIMYIGVNDRKTDLFEGQFSIPDGISYNSYVIIDEKIAVCDTVDAKFGEEWLKKLKNELGEREPDYLIIHHMEPDHSSSISAFCEIYKNTIVVSSKMSFAMMRQFYGLDLAKRQMAVSEGDTLSLGKHTLQFISAPMVHWPEVMMSFDTHSHVLFSADAFGKFGIGGDIEKWDEEASRYYFGIVGKFGAQVQALLKKADKLKIKAICPLHGPILDKNVSKYIDYYKKWSSYTPDKDGVFIAYSSVYGNTKNAVEYLYECLKQRGVSDIVIRDLARHDIYESVALAFRYKSVVLATTTYNTGIFPCMHTFVSYLAERGFSSERVAIIENGTWAPTCERIIKEMLSKTKTQFLPCKVSILSALNEGSREQIKIMADVLAEKK